MGEKNSFRGADNWYIRPKLQPSAAHFYLVSILLYVR